VEGDNEEPECELVLICQFKTGYKIQVRSQLDCEIANGLFLKSLEGATRRKQVLTLGTAVMWEWDVVISKFTVTQPMAIQ